MTNSLNSQFYIYCDGGIGNRLNALLSGMAIARHFNLSYVVHWPLNNWCEAGFQDIFDNKENVSTLSLKDLAGQMNECKMLLHDEMASTSLGVEFSSAYAFESLDDFHQQLIQHPQAVFYYPALIPQWVPGEAIANALRSLNFSPQICGEVVQFIEHHLKKPFHGLHLRRTDLTVGLTDLEVFKLAQHDADEVFYVCSDDPLAEALASAHSNVFSRKKQHKVEKMVKGSDWTSLQPDDDGRVYHGNIQRGKASVIEAVIDMLILAHGNIVGYSGSTFQQMARLIGSESPLLNWPKPRPLMFHSPTELKRQISAGVLSSDALIQSCNQMGTNGHIADAIELLQFSTSKFNATELNSILHTLAIFYLNQQLPQLAQTLLQKIVSSEPNRASSLLHLAYADLLIDDATSASAAMHQFMALKQCVNDSDQAVMNYLLSKLPA